MSNAFHLAAAAGLPRGLHFELVGGVAAGVSDATATIVDQIQPTTDTRLPGAAPMAGVVPPVLPAVGTEGELALDLDVNARRRFYNFLELSYRGSLEYKYGLDARGHRLLIEHENELAPYGTTDATTPDLQNRPDADAVKSNRYSRRCRVAIYENHVAPIIEKFVGYLSRNAPKRSKQVEAELQRLKLMQHMTGFLRSALMLTQYFPGWDARRETVAPGQLVTEAIAKSIDPANALKPYLIGVDPRRVLDIDYAPDGTIIRFCYEEEIRTKAGITSKPTVQYVYKEWFPTHWVCWEPVFPADEAKPARLTPANGMKVRVKEAGVHSFGRVPFVNLQPLFPTETLCDLNRALFNLTSLLHEELYNNTFTQFYILGARASDIKGTERGTGNAIVIEAATAKIGTFGAVDGQAEAIRETINSMREQIYTVASMNESATKNVAESAEKKKRDLESLYTMLISIARTLETAENALLVGMGLADYNQEDSLTRYPDKFDIASVADLLVEIAALNNVPLAPVSLKRSLTKQLAAKMDPFGPSHDPDVDKAFDIAPPLVGSVVDLLNAGALTPDMVVTALGIPEEHRAAVAQQLSQHKDKPLDPTDPNAMPDNPDDPEDAKRPPGGSEDPEDPADPEDDEDPEDDDTPAAKEA